MHLAIAQAVLLGSQVYNPVAWIFLGPMGVGLMALGSAAITAEIISSIAKAGNVDQQAPQWQPQERRIFRTRTVYNV